MRGSRKSYRELAEESGAKVKRFDSDGVSLKKAECPPNPPGQGVLPLSLALAKGKLLTDTMEILERSGYRFPGFSPGSRKLRFQSGDGSIEILMVRGSDVLSYVEYGGAHMGVVGLDLILEEDRPVLEPLDLKIGLCRLVVAAPIGQEEPPPLGRPIRVATKYPRLAEKYYVSRGVSVEILKLHGSLELAPKVGLSDRIVDLVATGKTIRENHLEIVDEILVSTGRIVVSRSAWPQRNQAIRSFLERISPHIPKDPVISS
jgi:ATP phosphoribosyltransferase